MERSLRTDPEMGELEDGHSAESNSVEDSAKLADGSVDPKVSEASKLFDKLFSQSPAENSEHVSAALPPPLAQTPEAGTTFIRKAGDDSHEHATPQTFKREEAAELNLPDRIAKESEEAAVAPALLKSIEAIRSQLPTGPQDIPASVDAVMSVKKKAELLVQESAAKHAAKPAINFPERVNNLKTQHDQLRARLASLE
jgi:hypothetical protein